jgi:signal transduction histidine kinase
MIRAFRKKIILLLDIAFLAAVVIILFAFYRISVQSDYNGVRETLTSYFQMPEETDLSAAAPAAQESPEGESGFARAPGEDVYAAGKDSDGTFSVLHLPRDGRLQEKEALSLAEGMFAQNRLDGTYENYQYESASVQDRLVLVFMDVSSVRAEEQTLLLRLILAGTGVFGALFLLSIWLSKWLVKPLEEAMQKQSDFILAAGHELKTPLTVMQTSLTMMERDGVKSKYLDYAKEESRKMKSLVTGLLDLSRLENPSAVDEFSEFDLSRCISLACLPFEAVIYEKGLALETDIEKDISCQGNEERIGQLAGILLDNAVKHTEKGGRIRICLRKDGKRIDFSVMNQGEAIPEEEREKIFERFYRGDKTRGRADERYGLGLSIAREIIKRHHASISVSCRDGWTSFDVKM